MTAPATLHSAIYEGWVSHQRLLPKVHHFSQRVSMVYLDLAELEAVFRQHPLWSLQAFNCASFRREDYHGDPSLPLDTAVRQTIAQASGCQPDGPIRVLTNLRYFGYIINPLTCYYCFDKSENLRFILAEVTNTPWRERHAYVLPLAPAYPTQAVIFPKRMHVSPFMPMDMDYLLKSSLPAAQLVLYMENRRAETLQFSASLRLRRMPASRQNMSRLLWRFPVMTLQVVAGIYWQALRLWLKGIRFIKHPRHLQAVADTKTDINAKQENSSFENI